MDKQEVKSKKQSAEKLVSLVKEKELHFHDQRSISDFVLDGVSLRFSELNEEQADQVLQVIATRGYTDLINKATGQTDLTDEVEDEKTTSLTVYDDEEEQMVEIDTKTRQIANDLQHFMDVTTMMTAVIMMRMSDEKLYRGVDQGYSSFREYTEMRCPFGYRQAQKYAAIGRKFAPLLPDEFSRGEFNSPDQNALNGNIESLGELGVNKLYELSKIEKADFSGLPSNGTVKLSDGSELDIEKIKSQSAIAFKDKIESYKKYQKELEKELNSTADARDKAIEKKKQAEEEAEVGRKYKDMFGKKSDQFEAQKSRLMEARSKAADLNQVLSKIKGLNPEFETLVEELQDLHGRIDRGLQNLRDDNRESGAFAQLSN